MAWTAWTAQQAQEPPGGTVCGRVQQQQVQVAEAAAASDISPGSFIQVRSEQEGAQATRSGRTVRGIWHGAGDARIGFWGRQGRHTTRKSKRTKTNETNRKVDS